MKYLNKAIRWNIVILISLLFVISFVGCSSDNTPTNPDNLPVPVLTTAAVSAITQTTAECGGTITSDSGASVTARGVCWSSSPMPTIANSKTTDGTGTGSFVSNIIGLTEDAKYYIRAYATNSAGTGYGNIISFTTITDGLGTVADIDGNIYQTVKIGDQWWMAENLRVSHYRNSDSIPNVTSSMAWENLSTGAYCNYDNDTSNVETYGRLYNWYTVNDNRHITPEGWHVPSDEEWKQLEMYLGMTESEVDALGTDEGGKLKDTGTTHWISPNTGATNESSFSALPGGDRRDNGTFSYSGYVAAFWSSSERYSSFAWYRYLYCSYSEIGRDGYRKRYGFSVRCVRD